MKKYIILLLLLLIVNSFLFADDYLNGDTFSELTKISTFGEVNTPSHSRNEDIDLTFYFISPNASIDYTEDEYAVAYGEGLGGGELYLLGNNYEHLLDFEEEFKEKYNLILVTIKINSGNSHFNLYEFRNSFTLEIDGEEYDSIDFYDFEHRGTGRAVFSSTRYVGRFGSYIISGYLMFPKIELDGVNNIQLTNTYFIEDINLNWNLEKINSLINVFK